MRSLDVPEEQQSAWLRRRTLNKNRQFLAKPAYTSYCFSEKTMSSLAVLVGHARPGRGARIGSDSEIARQTIENAQNGLGD
jgi:hypothetical protein